MVYLYACSKCGERIELERKVQERDNPVTCNRCGSPCKRLFVPTTNLFIKEFTWRYGSRSETAHLPDTDEEHEIWKRYG